MNDHRYGEVLRFYEKEKEKVEAKAAFSRAKLEKLSVPDVDDWDTIELQQSTTFFKVLASVKGNLVSVYDGSTQYEIGRWTLVKHGASSWPPLSSCFYGFQTVTQALEARFPKGSKLLDAPKVLMQFEASGKAYFNPRSGAWAVSSVRPIRILPNPVPSQAAQSHGDESKGVPWIP